MLNILFWNLNQKDLRESVYEAVKAEKVDVVLLIESGVDGIAMLGSLNRESCAEFYIPSEIGAKGAAGRFQVFSRDRNLDLSEFYESNRLTLRKLRYGPEDLILGVVHLMDPRNAGPNHQQALAQLLSDDLKLREQEQGNVRTIIIGDFNMNPFDPAFNLASGMNAMMTKKCVERVNRTFQDREYPFFYNPMWSLFGDGNPGPSGTYYHTNSSQGMFGWNMLDQVLLRPSVVQVFESVRVLDKAGGRTLKSSLHRPAESDHFPILLTLK